ncbi:N-acetylglucosamine-6-phosphate deacetylase [Mesoplasma lactucae]|uniref:N-acetylglucosamine-6-phosphate deacetylase n=1 Tax=Mesoplasma lactucae ATCC 49193 TaxID=81460 RepID=A0A291IRN7_9MOLU|nr:N-acetylglucosamine-6-phosphate deacetylase [Mesoplasma lactucae]ATG97420.1 N-acetylglucosamine-6-phosphate deacetylase [Mesoplasma lactucae ATCC 49193]ATZ20127.1 N-acetylglucosamine-6-phosphate deacetylase [Mesoplasma lactucae ATCC 49193]MCL8216875.1 N-acetylglucosamine-6-phosphate deacetylase [Mesoplasma lactucae ATCC 49193]
MILKNAKIVLENEIINGYVEITDDKIIDIKQGDYSGSDAVDLEGNWLLPGFIDCHVHGGYGISFESGSVEAYKEYAKKTTIEGVTGYCFTSVTNSDADNDKYYSEFGKFMVNENHGLQAKCFGAHMEGPFISPLKKGAHDPKLIKKPSIELTKRWNDLANGTLRIVTYAPEEQNGEYTTWLIQNKILPSAGHSNVSAIEFEKNDYRLGVRHVTHLFNQMSEVDHHNPGLAVFALTHDDILAEVISDGVHIQPEVLKMIYDCKSADSICIVTDGMLAKGMPDGNYILGELPVYKKGIEVRLQHGDNLAASAAPYDHNVRFYQKTCDIPMTELIKMTSINIAKQLNIFDKTGSIEINKQADLVCLDKDLKVLKTIVDGKICYEKRNEH